jgi:hypothetical protein
MSDFFQVGKPGSIGGPTFVTNVHTSRGVLTELNAGTEVLCYYANTRRYDATAVIGISD